MKNLKLTGKRALSLILTFVLILSLPLCINAATVGLATTGEIKTGNCGANGDNVTYSLDTATGVLTITGNGGIRFHSFRNTKTIKSVIINEGVTSIGEASFYNCTSLESVLIPQSVTFISNEAFQMCTSLKEINLPSEIRSIGKRTFSSCNSLKSIEIPAKVTSIGDYAFSNCQKFVSVELPASVTSIGEYAFTNCKNLESVCINNRNTKIDPFAFIDRPSSFTLIGYYDSTAQKHAKSTANGKKVFNFVPLDKAVLKVTSNYYNTIPPVYTEYGDVTTVNTREISSKDIDEMLMLGLYSDNGYRTALGDSLNLTEGMTTVYSYWTSVSTLKAEAEDKTGSTAQTSGFDLYGAQFREKANNWTAGLRFCTRVSKSLISQIESKTGNPVECGYVVCKKDSVPANTELTVGMTTTNGNTIKENSTPKKYFDGDKYFVYTAVITDIPESMQGTDIVARPYIKYTDANGVLRYYYFTESGSSNCGGGYYTSYAAVESAHNAAQG